MHPEISELDVGRSLVLQELARRLRHQGLASMSEGEHPGAAVERGPEVVAAPQLDLSGVQGDPRPQLETTRPVRGPECALDLEGAGRGVPRPHEDREDAVALASTFDDGTGIPLDGSVDDLVVSDHRRSHRAGLRLPGPRGVLQVREQERERAGGKHGHE